VRLVLRRRIKDDEEKCVAHGVRKGEKLKRRTRRNLEKRTKRAEEGSRRARSVTFTRGEKEGGRSAAFKIAERSARRRA